MCKSNKNDVGFALIVNSVLWALLGGAAVGMVLTTFLANPDSGATESIITKQEKECLEKYEPKPTPKSTGYIYW